jgi:hypothetical protein
MAEVEVRSSPIQGLGLFMLRDVRAGERIRQVNVVREITSDCPLRPDLGERAEHCDYPDGKVVLIGPPDRHLNHSCDPNTYIVYEADSCFIVARRDIPAGQEITCDYSLNVTGGDSWPCNCGADRCRGQITGDFFRLPDEFQREYHPYLAEWFVRSHRERLEKLG